MRRPVFFYIAAAVAVLGVILAVYFMIPGIYHPFITMSDGKIYFVDPARHPNLVKSAHHLYAAAFFGLAVIVAFAAYLFRPKHVAKAV